MRNGASRVSPKSDQPLASFKSAERGQQPATLQYKVSGIRTLSKNQTRGYDRSGRG